MTTKEISKQGILAAVYVVCCIVFAPISFGMIQLRVSEMLMVYAFYERKNTIGLTIGCAIANMFSPLGIVDMIFGAAGTLVICLLLSTQRSKIFLSTIAACMAGLVVGTELHLILGMPFVLSIVTVAIGEFIAVQTGVFVFMYLEKQAWFKA